MRKKTICGIGLVVLLAFFLYGCAAGGKQFYDTGAQLRDVGKYKDAIAYFEQAVEKEPDNEQYKEALSEIKENLVQDLVAEGSRALDSESPLTIVAINKAKAKLTEAKEIDPGHSAVLGFSSKLAREESALLSEVKDLHVQARQYMEAEQWLKAYFALQQVQSLFPNYEDSFLLLTQTSDKGSQALYEQAKLLFDKEDYRGATQKLHEALSLKEDHKAAGKLLPVVQTRDSKDYFVEEAKKAVRAQKWDQACKAYERALEYDRHNPSLMQALHGARAKAAIFHIDEAKAQMYAGWLFKAFESFGLAAQYAGSGGTKELSSLRNDLALRASSLADRFKEEGRFGAAWFWYEKIKDIALDFPQIFYLGQEMQDKIIQRIKKSIAVFDFNSPSSYSDAGIMVANNLITFLFKNASGDVKILERENLKSILEEMKLGQMGVVSTTSAKEMGRVYGIDVAIMGSVLLYKVESITSDSTKTVRYQVGTTIKDNIEYLNWKAKHPRASKEELAEAPPAKIAVPEFAEKDYKTSHQKKVGFVQVSFRIVDVSTGENIQVKTIERKEVAEDKTSAGLPEAGVKFDPMEIPSDTELLQKMTDEVVAELGREALRPLQNLETTYFQSGEKFLQRRDKLQAAESFIDAIFDEKLKRIQDSPMTHKARGNLEGIFRDYQVKLGG